MGYRERVIAAVTVSHQGFSRGYVGEAVGGGWGDLASVGMLLCHVAGGQAGGAVSDRTHGRALLRLLQAVSSQEVAREILREALSQQQPSQAEHGQAASEAVPPSLDGRGDGMSEVQLPLPLQSAEMAVAPPPATVQSAALRFQLPQRTSLPFCALPSPPLPCPSLPCHAVPSSFLPSPPLSSRCRDCRRVCLFLVHRRRNSHTTITITTTMT